MSWLMENRPSHNQRVLSEIMLCILHGDRYVEFRKNWFGNDQILAMVHLLKQNTVIQLSLESIDMPCGGMTDIVNALKDSQLEMLRLQDIQNFGDEETTGIAKVLKDTRITDLCLVGNDMTEVGAIAIADGLKDSRVTSLDVGCNDLGDTGVLAIVEVLKNTRIAELNLCETNITERGARAIADGLKDSPVTSLDISDNDIGDVGAKAIANVLKDTGITDLKFDRLGATDPKNIKRISSALKRNRSNISNLCNRFRSFVSHENEIMEFVVRDGSKPSEYIAFTKMISRKKRSFASHLPGAECFIRDIELRLAEFFGKLDQSMIEHVKLLLSCEAKGLSLVVENLLDHRSNYSLVQSEVGDHPLNGILHPAVYIVMEKYRKPWYFERMRPTKEELIELFEKKDWDHLIQQKELGRVSSGRYIKRRLLAILSKTEVNETQTRRLLKRKL